VREIEETRERLQDGLEELAGRLPRLPQAGPEAGKKVLLPVAGAAAGALVVWLVDRKVRRRRAAAEAAAHVVPEEWREAFRDGAWKGPATVAAGIWSVLRLAEIRSMRRLSKTLARANAVVEPRRKR
jgi:hypothetical protein